MVKRYDPILCMMVEDYSVKTKDESYFIRGRKYKVIERKGDNVKVLGPDGKVTNMSIDFMMSEGKKTSDSKNIDEAIRALDTSVITYNEIKSVYNLVSNALMYRGNEGKLVNLLEKAQSELLSIASKTK